MVALAPEESALGDMVVHFLILILLLIIVAFGNLRRSSNFLRIESTSNVKVIENAFRFVDV